MGIPSEDTISQISHYENINATESAVSDGEELLTKQNVNSFEEEEVYIQHTLALLDEIREATHA